MLVLQYVVALLREKRAHDHLNLKAAGLSCADGTLTVDMRVGICLVRADDDHAGSPVIQRLDVAEHASTAITVQAELAIAAPLSEGAMEFTGYLLEYHSADDTAASKNPATPIGFADAIEPG